VRTVTALFLERDVVINIQCKQ